MAGLWAEVAVEGSRLVAISFGVSAVSAVSGRVGDLDEAPAVEHDPRPPAGGDEPQGQYFF